MKHIWLLVCFVLLSVVFAHASTEHNLEKEEGRVLELDPLPSMPSLLDIAESTQKRSDNRLMMGADSPHDDTANLKAGLAMLTSEVLALRNSIEDVRKTPLPAGVSVIQPFGPQNSPNGFTPNRMNNQFYVQGAPVPGATVRDLSKLKRGPVGRLKIAVTPDPNQIQKIKQEIQAAKEKKAAAAAAAREAAKPVDFTKNRGPLGKLKMELPDTKALLQKLDPQVTQTPTQPAPAPAPARRRRTKLRKNRGPVGKLNITAHVPPALTTHMPLLSVSPVAIPVIPVVPRKVLNLTADRGPVGKLQIKLFNPPQPAPTPMAPTMATPLGVAVLPQPMAPRRNITGRGPVGKLRKRRVPVAKPAPAAPTATTAPEQAAQVVRQRLRRRALRGDRGPVGRLQAQKAALARPPGSAGSAVIDPTVLQAKRLAKKMFQEWVAQYKQTIDQQNLQAANALAAKY